MKLIAGPCQHESLEMSQEIAKRCQSIASAYNFDYFFKASWDKANRTHNSGVRGLLNNPYDSIGRFCEDMEKVPGRKLTDIHEPWQAAELANTVDVIQIPAFLSRQTDLIKAACETNKIVNVKKGQFMAPWDLKGVISKCEKAKDVWVTERGTSFGYNNLVVDFIAVQKMIEEYQRAEHHLAPGVVVRSQFVFDATHSVQKPGSLGLPGSRFAGGLAKAAAAVGCKNFFFEVHPNPSAHPSDGHNMLTLDEFEEVVRDLHKIIKLI